MKTTILIIHGAGTRAYKVMKQSWLPRLETYFGPNSEVLLPEMPSPQFPQYALWKEVIKKLIASHPGPLILVGHSLGGSVLLKYLSSEEHPKNLQGVFIVASPFFSEEEGWPFDDFFLEKDLSKDLKTPIFLYHSSDDKIVPAAHQGFIKKKIPQAVVRKLTGYGHEFNGTEFKEILQDIKGLSSQ